MQIMSAQNISCTSRKSGVTLRMIQSQIFDNEVAIIFLAILSIDYREMEC